MQYIVLWFSSHIAVNMLRLVFQGFELYRQELFQLFAHVHDTRKAASSVVIEPMHGYSRIPIELNTDGKNVGIPVKQSPSKSM